MTSLMLHRCRTGSISLERWWQSPSAAISESDWFLYRAGISRRMTSCTVVSWRKGELLRNNRHHWVSSRIAECLKKSGKFDIYEEVHCISSTHATKHADIIAIDNNQKIDFIIDPTIRFEGAELQPQEVDLEKKRHYEPCFTYLEEKCHIPVCRCELVWSRKINYVTFKFPRPDTTRFLFLGFREEDVCAQRPRDSHDLKAKILSASEEVTPEMLDHMWEDLASRYELCRVRNGGHVEV
ncbi:hypothetical protein ANN_23326 [Periplaneta americana]|uniref:Uncharacterized protein n=1 Tax=Periplaneta americana TaxID=6978 RepID=A0ABQ8SKV3_PERAM|nr:hypothetical protein ANN_23326 [Periplaneta americana]